jgi:GxxExxY protein
MTTRTAPLLLLESEVFRIRGAVFQVRKSMGSGFLEAVYQECLAIEFRRQEIPFRDQVALPLDYQGVRLRQTYVADFICFDQVILELKAVRVLAPEHRAQILNYLRATRIKVGLLVNFGAPAGVEIERFAR